MSSKYGILAYPAGHSLSPAVHNAAFKAAGVDAEYEVCDVKPEDLEVFMNEMKGGAYDGLSVSSPHKEAVIDFMDNISPDAYDIRAVNTVVLKKGKLIGSNTDWVGALEALKRSGVESLVGKKVVILGAGGAARAIAYGLLKERAHVVVLNRTMDKAQKLANDLSGLFKGNASGSLRFGAIEGIGNFEPDILIQATSIWTTSGTEAQILPSGYLTGLAREGVRPLVMDIVYKPRITPLLFAAEDADCDVITGDKMLLYQAVAQFETWTGKKATKKVVEAMEVALKEGLK